MNIELDDNLESWKHRLGDKPFAFLAILLSQASNPSTAECSSKF